MATKYGGVVPIQHLEYVAPGVIELGINTTGTQFTFTPGQYIRITLPELEDSGLPEQATYRDFSLSNIPHDPIVTTVFRAGGSPFKQSIVQKRPGDSVMIDGPFGVFTAPENPAIQQVYIAGGIGITPFMSLIRSQLARPLTHPIMLLYFYHDKLTTPYLNELRNLVGNKLLLYEYQGSVTSRRLWEHAIDPTAAVYVAGPPTMVQSVRQLLTQAGFPPSQIKTESFTGYAE